MGVQKPRYHPSIYTDSKMVPRTLHGLLGEIARIAQEWELRDDIEAKGGDNATYDSFMWRDCIELAGAIARGAKRAEAE